MSFLYTHLSLSPPGKVIAVGQVERLKPRDKFWAGSLIKARQEKKKKPAWKTARNF